MKNPRSSLRRTCSFEGGRRPDDMADWKLLSIGHSTTAYQVMCVLCGRSLGRIYDEDAAAAITAGAAVVGSTSRW